MNLWQRHILAVAAAFAAAAAVAAQPVQSKAELPPIKVGAVSSLTGPAPFPEATEAARAYFNVVNAAGGIKGRPLQLVVMDDKGDPAIAKDTAKSLVEDRGVLAHVGSSSIADCTANSEYYRTHGVLSIQGTGIEPACFASPHIAPVNTGPYLSMHNALDFATRILRATRPCAFIFDIPVMRAGYEPVIAAWGRTGKVSLAMRYYFRSDEDFAALMRQAVQNRCDAIVNSAPEPLVIAWVQASRSVPELRLIPQVFLTPAYTAKVASSLAGGNDRIYTMAEYSDADRSW